jgi:hypothetical protein
MSHADSSMSWNSLNGGPDRSRSVSPYNNGNYRSTGVRTRSSSPSRRSIKTSQSVDLERRGRSQTPQRRSNLRSSTTRLYDNNDNYHNKDDGKSLFIYFSIFISFFFFYLQTI